MTLTDAINQILGKPFQLGAAGPEAFDCWGVVRYLARELMDLELADPKVSGFEALRSLRRRFLLVRDPRDLDVVEVRTGANTAHVAVVEGRGLVSSAPGLGVHRLRWAELPPGRRRIYRLREGL